MFGSRFTRALCALTLLVSASAGSIGCSAEEAAKLTDGRGGPSYAPKSPAPDDADGDAGVDLPPEGAQSPRPVAKGVSPANALVGGISPTVAVMGSSFMPRSVVELDGKALGTSYVSGTELRATLPDTLTKGTGVHKIAVSTTSPGGGRSSEVSFTIENPVATLSTLTPNAVLASAGDTVVTIEGSGFVTGSQATLAGTSLSTSVASPTQILATIPAGKLALATLSPIVVVNPAPGGGTSTALSFTIANPTVTVTSVTPSSAVVGSAAATITLAGTGFVDQSAVMFNGAAVTSHYVSATSLTADVPATALATTGNFPVVVMNPQPGGGVSMPVTFSVGNPTPTIATLTPSSATAGAAPVTVTVDGTGYVKTSIVQLNGAPSATTYVSASEVKATITAAQLASAGTIAVTVVNPTPGGGTSNASTFTVNNPTPTLTDLSPSTLTSGASDSTITLYGTLFVTGAVAKADGAALVTTFVSASELRAVVPASKLTTATTIAVTVTNPNPGSSTSGAQTLTVEDDTSTGTGDDGGGMSCDTTGVDVALDAVGVSKNASLTYDQGPSPRFAYNPDESTFYTCPVGTLSTSTQYYAAVVVQNTTGSSAYLDANASCASTDDAFMAAYDFTSTIPTSDDDRKACTGFVANGASGGGAYGSDDANGSAYCPGLTKANGGAIVLAPCEKAVILVQPYEYPTYTAPFVVGLSLED